MPITHTDYLNMLVRTRHNAQRGEVKSATAVAGGTEKKLHEEILEHCRANGYLAFHSRTDWRTSRQLGEPDFCVLLPGGRTVYVEAKTATGKLRPEQAAVAAWMQRLGHNLFIVRSLQEFIEVTRDTKPEGKTAPNIPQP